MAGIHIQNLFDVPPSPASQEIFTKLVETPALRVERIVSAGNHSPEGHWYDQNDPEWVVLVQGTATLEWEDGELLELRRGDYLLIPPHARHRVARTSPDAVWLAIHYRAEPA